MVWQALVRIREDSQMITLVVERLEVLEIVRNDDVLVLNAPFKQRLVRSLFTYLVFRLHYFDTFLTEDPLERSVHVLVKQESRGHATEQVPSASGFPREVRRMRHGSLARQRTISVLA